MEKQYKITLASASPRRRELLGRLGFDFTIAEIKDIAETYPADMPAQDVAPYLSRLKAQAYIESLDRDTILITADTVVILDNEVLGKPKDLDEARLMLHRLSGRTHQVVSGVSVATLDEIRTIDATTDVTFSQLSDDEIDYYVDTFRPLDKAGAYGIQEWIGCIGIKNIEGSYYNVMGLPLHRLYRLLSPLMGRT